MLAASPEIELQVFFCSRWGAEEYRDAGFGKTFSWDTPLLDGYSYRFLSNWGYRSGFSTFFSVANPGAGKVAFKGFDAVLINGWSLMTNWLVWMACTLSGTPLLVRGESNGLRERKGVKGLLKRAGVSVFLRRAAACLSIGSSNAAFYRSYGVDQKRIFSTPYAVDNRFFMEQARKYEGQKQAIRVKEGLPTDKPLIMFCGKFQPKKRPLDLLEAFARVQHDTPAALVFVGDGELRPDMEAYVKQAKLTDVHLVGFRNQGEIGPYYATADVLVLPSDFEPWGLVINEAMCFGLPIVASDQVGAAADLVRHGENGYVFPVGATNALAEHLTTLVSDASLRARMGCASQQMISTWGLEQDVQGVLEALDCVTSHGRRLRNPEK